jgi:hypothetical protein
MSKEWAESKAWGVSTWSGLLSLIIFPMLEL